MSTEKRAARSLSYFDRYPERKGSAHLVANAKLLSSSKGIASSSKAAMEPAEAQRNVFSKSVNAPSPLHFEKRTGRQQAATVRQPASAATSPAGALERYKLQTNAAASARTAPEGSKGERAPKKRLARNDQALHQNSAPQNHIDGEAKPLHLPSPSRLRYTTECESGVDLREVEGWSRRCAVSASENVVSIDDIVRKHSPTTPKKTLLRGETIGWTPQRGDSQTRTTSTSVAPAGKDSDDSDRSSLDSVERELKHTLRFSTSDQDRTAQASASPALQAIFSGSQGSPSVRKGAVGRHQMAPSPSAPILLHKQSSPTLLTSSRLSDTSPMDHEPDSGIPGKVRQSKIKPFLPNLSAKMSRSKSTMNLKSTANDGRVSSIPELPIPQPLPKVSTPTKFLSPSRTSNLESSFDDSYDLASTTRYLRSTRLTTLMTLQRPLYAGSVISLADVGDVGGHAVFLFLGLGAVRYLAGLYDDMASALGLRLICIDRWGMGKTDDLPADRRGILEWSEVVREVADRLGVGRFSILAHSAGAPYAMALSLSLGHRLAGPIHLLAPWVSAALESGYKWLRYVPDGIIKTAQAAEWRMQGWKLGASTLSPDTSVSFKKANGTNQAPPDFHRTNNALQALQSFDSSTASSLTQGESVYFSPLPSPSLIGESPFYDGQTTACSSQSSSRLTKFKGRQSTSDRAKDAAIADVSGSSSYEMTEDFALIKAWHARSHSDTATIQDTQPPPLPPKTPMRHNRVVSTRADVSLASLPSPSTPASSGKRQSLTPSLDLPTELLRASHAESSGSASDLLVILGRSSQKPWGFSYIDVKHPVLVWHGERDERVSVSSVLWMERELDNCKVNIIKNADHSLMTNVDVVVEALESIVATLF